VNHIEFLIKGRPQGTRLLKSSAAERHPLDLPMSIVGFPDKLQTGALGSNYQERSG
jgi:hypothetical protein